MMSSQFSTRQSLTSRWSRINFRFQFNSADVFRRSEYLNVPNFITISQPRLSYNYFRFGKTNGRHTEILRPVMSLTWQPSSASHFASEYQISYESDNRWRSYDVTKILKMVAIDVANQFRLQFDSAVVLKTRSLSVPNFANISCQILRRSVILLLRYRDFSIFNMAALLTILSPPECQFQCD